MAGYTFELCRSRNKEFYGRAIRNGREIWRTSETYKRKLPVKKAILGLIQVGKFENWAVRDLTVTPVQTTEANEWRR